jgi:glucose-1-phosphate thymidylyltransferase
MRAIIPVAGLGSRLKPHTHTLPKVLLNVGGKPILGHIIDKVRNAGVTKFTFVLGHLGEMVHEYVSTHFPDITADYVEQKTTEGLGHAIYTAIPTFDEDELFIILGDTIFDVDLDELFRQKTSALGVKYVDDPRRFGVAMLKDGYIEKLIEKPQEPVSNLALVGLYYITNKNVFTQCLETLIEKDIRTKGELQLTDALQLMIDEGEKVATFPVEGWYDCGKPETLLATNSYLLSLNSSYSNFDTVIIVPPVYIPEGTIITNSVIGPNTTIGEGVEIQDCIIRNSIIGNNARLQVSLLQDSIIGNNSEIIGAFKQLNSGDSTEIKFY